MTPVAGGDKPFVDHFIVDLKATYLPTVGYYSMAWQQSAMALNMTLDTKRGEARCNNNGLTEHYE